MQKQRALIVGGSLGGLLAANLFRAIGWDVQVFERASDDLESRGAGIGLNDQLFDVFKRVGVTVDDSLGVVPKSRTCFDPLGKVLVEYKRGKVLSSWGRVYRSLKDTLPRENYHFGKTLSDFSQSGGRVLARFADGSRAEGDLLVGADGIRSTVRSHILPAVQPRYAGYIAWRGIIDESAMSPELHAAIFERNIICLPEGEMMSGYPVPGPSNDVRPGFRSYNLVWYHPVTEANLRDLCTDATGHCHGNSIAPQLIRPELIADMRALARRVLAPYCASFIEQIPKPFFQAIYDLQSPTLVVGRAVLMGDAAFVARPHVGMGVTKAALDAECLVDELSASGASIESALAGYDTQQREFGEGVVARARWIGAHLEAQNKPRELRTHAELHPDLQEFMHASGASLNEVPVLLQLVVARRARAQQRRLAT